MIGKIEENLDTGDGNKIMGRLQSKDDIEEELAKETSKISLEIKKVSVTHKLTMELITILRRKVKMNKTPRLKRRCFFKFTKKRERKHAKLTVADIGAAQIGIKLVNQNRRSQLGSKKEGGNISENIGMNEVSKYRQLNNINQ